MNTTEEMDTHTAEHCPESKDGGSDCIVHYPCTACDKWLDLEHAEGDESRYAYYPRSDVRDDERNTVDGIDDPYCTACIEKKEHLKGYPDA